MKNHKDEFYLTIGIVVSGLIGDESATPYVNAAVQELAHSRVFLSGNVRAGQLATHKQDFDRIEVATSLNFRRREGAKGSLIPEQSRLLSEKLELDQQICKLDDFIVRDPKFLDLPADERVCIKRQLDAMIALSSIQGERIAKF